MWAYTVDFNLDIQGFYQAFLAFVNPIPLGLLFIGLALYFKRSAIFYGFSILFIFCSLSGCFQNAVYYREFSDFVTVNTMMASSSVSAGLGEAALGLFRPWDIIYLIDFPILGNTSCIKSSSGLTIVHLIRELALPSQHFLLCSLQPISFGGN